MSSSRFATHTHVERSGPGRWSATLSDTWNIGPVPNGGYQLALLSRAALAELALDHGGVDDLVNVSCYFVSPAAPGPATLEVEVIKRGRTTSLAQVRLVQDGLERARALVLGGALAKFEGPELHTETPPELPPPEQCLRIPKGAGPQINGEVEMRFDPATALFLRGERNGPARQRAWIRLADGAEPDVLSLATFADALPPTTFNVYGMTGWVPTLELTVQIRRRPAPGWVRASVNTQHISAGHLEEDCTLWDAEGHVVALSRQRAMLLGK